MAFWSSWLSRDNDPQPTSGLRRPQSLAGRRVRQTADTSAELPFFSALTIQPPPSADETWRSANLDSKTLDKLPVDELIELLVDLSPEISRALFDFVRFVNPGFEVRALRVGSDDIDERAQAMLDEFTERLKALYGAPDVVWNRMILGGFIRGAFFGEAVLGENGRDFVDLATPDPWSARFEKVTDPIRGNIWALGQFQGGRFVRLDEDPTVFYIPIDPMPGSPYGRALVSPGVFVALFIIGLLHDLRRVIAQQGYPRLDLVVSLERLREAMPGDLESDPVKVQEWVDAIISEISTAYGSLEPDDAYVHTDVVKVEDNVGALDGSLGSIGEIISSLERMAVRSLKTMPLLMGLDQGGSEATANRQWELHAAGIKSIQHLLEALLERIFRVSLQAQGLDAVVEFRFAELRASEMLRDAQTETLQIANARAKYDNGWISQDQASEEITGSEADVPEPRAEAVGFQFMEGDGDGEERSRGRVPIGRAVTISPDGSGEPLPPEPQEVEVDNDDADLAAETWDEVMSDYEGLLLARVVGRVDFDEDEFTEDGDSDWTWDVNRRRYRNERTGETLSQRKLTDLRDEFVESIKESGSERLSQSASLRQTDELADRLTSGDITIQRWTLDMRAEIKESYLSQYMLAKGGKNNMTQSDYGRIGRMLAPNGQYQRLQNFAEEIRAGNLSTRQIKARSRQYINSSTQSFERGRVASYAGDLRLPQYPADGSQVCRANCKCEWRIVEFDDRFEATWILNPAAEHCETCEENEARWAPLVVLKTEIRNRRELAVHLGNLETANGRG